VIHHFSGKLGRRSLRRIRNLQMQRPSRSIDSTAHVQPALGPGPAFSPQPPHSTRRIVQSQQHGRLQVERHQRVIELSTGLVDLALPVPVFPVPMQLANRRTPPACGHCKASQQAAQRPQQRPPVARRRTFPPPAGDTGSQQPAEKQKKQQETRTPQGVAHRWGVVQAQNKSRFKFA